MVIDAHARDLGERKNIKPGIIKLEDHAPKTADVNEIRMRNAKDSPVGDVNHKRLKGNRMHQAFDGFIHGPNVSRRSD